LFALWLLDVLVHTIKPQHMKVDITPGILPFALRASLRLFKFAPGEFVRLSALPKRWISVTVPHSALARSTPA